MSIQVLDELHNFKLLKEKFPRLANSWAKMVKSLERDQALTPTYSPPCLMKENENNFKKLEFFSVVLN